MYSHVKCAISVCWRFVQKTEMYTQTEVSDILQISGGMLTNVSKKRKIEEGNLQKVKVTILRHQNIQRLMLSLQLVHACSSSGESSSSNDG